MRKFLKLLCFVFITVFVIGFGGESVFAAPNNIDVTTGNYWYVVQGQGGSYVKTTTIDGKTYYIFCLDSNKAINDYNVTLDNSLYSSSKTGVARIYFRASQLGLGDGNASHTFKISNKSYTVSESDLYGITQSAIWYAVHGTGTGGYDWLYSNWVETKGYKPIFDELIKSITNFPGNYSIYFHQNGPGNITETTEGETTYLESDPYAIGTNNSALNGLRYKVSVTGGEIKVKDGEWTTSQVTVNEGDNIYVRMVKPTTGTGDVAASLSAVSDEFPSTYNAYFYKADGNSQNMGLVLPEFKSLSTTQRIKGSYENDTDVSIQKIDITTNKKLAGAVIKVYDKNNNELATVTSTGPNEANPKVSLSADTGYYIKETVAPSGYKLDATPVYFDVVKNGNEYEIYQGDQVVSDATLSILDSPIKIKYRKVDENGRGIAGVQIEIYDYIKRLATPDRKYDICAITDSDGYLTKPCNVENASNYYSADGLYPYITGAYSVKESNTPKGYSTASFNGNTINYGLSDEGPVVYPGTSVQGTFGEDAVITFNLINYRYIDISKTDLGGTELPGAKMNLYDGENKDYYIVSGKENADDIAPYVLLDSWTSGDTPHRFNGVVPGHKYILTEEVAPTGYVKITTNIEFKMDANGKVEVLSKDASTSDSAYKLTVMNDYTKVTFSKSSATTGAEVPGAHLKICTLDEYNNAVNDKKDGSACIALEEWDSTNKPHEVDMLPTGKYVLIETLAPAGYVKQTNAVEFEVKDSKILAVEMINEPTKVTISKKDISNDQELPGAHLKICTLTSYETDGVNCNPDNEAWSWVSTDTPNVIEALPYGDYVLIETLPTPDYQEGMIIEGNIVTAYNFTISEENNNIKIDVYNKLLTRVPNTGISTLNLFAIGGLLVFVGYETIRIYRRRNNA